MAKGPVELYWKPGWTGCVKAREFLVRKRGESNVKLRHLLKEKLTRAEIEALAKRVGDAQLLVAPKRKAEAAGLSGAKLLDWLAADGGNLRRPIVIVDGKITLGFNAAAQAELEDRV